MILVCKYCQLNSKKLSIWAFNLFFVSNGRTWKLLKILASLDIDMRWKLCYQILNKDILSWSEGTSATNAHARLTWSLERMPHNQLKCPPLWWPTSNCRTGPSTLKYLRLYVTSPFCCLKLSRSMTLVEQLVNITARGSSEDVEKWLFNHSLHICWEMVWIFPLVFIDCEEWRCVIQSARNDGDVAMV